MAEFTDKVFEIVKQIPCGKVSTYGQIAKLIGSPRSARYVGYALRRNPNAKVYPCHRVLFRDGSLCDAFVFGGSNAQKKLLEDERVTFIDADHVDLSRHLWLPELDQLGHSPDIDSKKRAAARPARMPDVHAQ